MRILKIVLNVIGYACAMMVIGVLFYATVVVGAVEPTIFFLMP